MVEPVETTIGRNLACIGGEPLSGYGMRHDPTRRADET